MQDLFILRLERSRKAIKHWWLLLLLGITIFVFGVITLAYPAESYLALSLAFGFLILASGVVSIVLAFTNDNVLLGKGWIFALGIIEILLGIILIFAIEITLVTLPILLGFWLLLRSFTMIGTGSDMISAKVKDGRWVVLIGVLLLICSIIILIHPLRFGIGAVVVWVGATFLLTGIAVAYVGFQLRNLHRYFN